VDALGLLLVLLIVPAIIVWTLWYQYRRIQLTRTWAATVGWTYVGSDPSLADRWRGQPFGIGHSRRVSEVVTGAFQGRPATSFAYRYTTGSGKSQSTHVFHVVTTALPAYLPTLELTPEGVGAKIAKAFGGDDIQFESDDFNRAWRVCASDERFAHDVVHPRLMERLLRGDIRTNLRIEGTDILSWASGSPDLGAVAPRLQLMEAVVSAIPRYVWLDHGHDPGYGGTDPEPSGPSDGGSPTASA
jgi:hypothetical protein